MGTLQYSSTYQVEIERFGVYLVDLHPAVGTKPGKLRPCVVIQPDEINEIGHPSTVILPFTTSIQNKDAFPLRVFIPRGEGGVSRDSVVMVDQILAWDNRRFRKKLGDLSPPKREELERACRDFFGWV